MRPSASERHHDVIGYPYRSHADVPGRNQHAESLIPTRLFNLFVQSVDFHDLLSEN